MQVGSLLLTVTLVTGILATFPLTVAIYALVLGVRWLGVLHFLGIFIILGIGADDVFVVLEHWKVRRLCFSLAKTLGCQSRILSWLISFFTL